jgi:hypothetical protein
MPGARFFTRSDGPPQDGRRREDASLVTRAVRPGPAMIATRSICPSSRQGRLPLARKLSRGSSSWLSLCPREFGSIAPNGVQDDGKLAHHSNGGALPADALGEPQRPRLEWTRSADTRHEHAGGFVARQMPIDIRRRSSDPIVILIRVTVIFCALNRAPLIPRRLGPEAGREKIDQASDLGGGILPRRIDH